MHDAVDTAWKSVVKQWDDPQRHDELFALVVEYQQYAWAAARYRERAGDPIADKQLERIGKAAMATMLATATARYPKEATPYRKVIVWIVVLLAMALAGLVFTRVVLDNTRAAPTTPARP